MVYKQRKSGIDIVGNVAWGTHFSQFYNSKDDLVDILVPYFKAGLENNEFCMWITSEPLNVEEAEIALSKVLPNIGTYFENKQLEIISYNESYVNKGVFESENVFNGWISKLNSALDNGFDGLRVSVNTSSENKGGGFNYEEELDDIVGNSQILALFTYNLDNCDAVEIVDAVNSHQFALIKRKHEWCLVNSYKDKKVAHKLKKAEKQLRENERIRSKLSERLNQAQIVGMIGSWEWDLKTDDVWWSNETYRIFGVTPDNFTPSFESNSNFIHPDDLDLYNKAFENSLKTGESLDLDVRILLEDGTVKFCNSKGKIIYDDSNQPMNFVGTVMDVTRRKNAEKDLKSENELRQAIIDTIPVMITVYEPKDLKFVVNREFERVLGWTNEDIKNIDLMAEIFPDPEYREMVTEYVRSLTPGFIEQKMVAKNGSVIETSWANVKITDGRQVGIWLDIRKNKKAEEEIKNLNMELGNRVDELQTLLDIAPAVIWIAHDPECRYITGNKYANEMVMQVPVESNISRSASAEETDVNYDVYRNGLKLKPEEMPAQVAAFTGKPVDLTELDLVFQDGRTVQIAISAVPLFDDEGNIRGSVTAGIDITKRKEAEKALKDNEERFRTFIDSSFDVVYRMNSDWSEMQELQGRNFIPNTNNPNTTWIDKYIHPDDQHMLLTAIKAALENKSIFELEHRIMQVDGTLGWTRSRAIPLQDSDGEIVEWFGTAKNITPQKKVEEDLKNSYKRLEVASRAANAGIWDWDVKKGTIQWSQMMYQLLGIAPENTPSFEIWDSVLHPEDIKIAKERIEDAVTKNTFLDSEYRIIRPDGEIRWINALGKTEYDDDNRPLSMTGICIDVTGRKLAEKRTQELLEAEQRLSEELEISNKELLGTTEALQSANKELITIQRELRETIDKLEISNRELEQFAYVASHDLQEPLRMVNSFTQLLEMRYKDRLDKDADEFIEFIVEGANRMKDLIDDLLNFSRLNTETKPIELVNMEESVNAVVSYIEPSVEPFQITCDPLPSIMGDPSQIKQLFQNLLSNAIKFCDHQHPEIYVSSQKFGNEWKIGVVDNGIGIGPEHQEKIFKIFNRLHTREEYKGTGIGLAICKRIVERHGGRIWVESQEGEGSAFYFTLPIYKL